MAEMSDSGPFIQRLRPVRVSQAREAIALQQQLEATQAALAEETRRRHAADASFIAELDRHRATLAALSEETRRREGLQAELLRERARGDQLERLAADVARAGRDVLHGGAEPAAPPQPEAASQEPVAARLASVLELVTSEPAPAVPWGPDERVRRFRQVRERLA